MPNRFIYPRPEYPRPDRRRGSEEGKDWLNLNGPWQFRFDGDRCGEQEQWFAPGPDWREQIIVPFCWESLAAWGDGDSAGNDNYYSTRVFRKPIEVTRSNHRSTPRYEVGWYRKRVAIPNGMEWDRKRVILTVGAADFFTDAWVNGKHLGHHEGGYTPFEFDITDALVDEEGMRTALIVLRVEDPMDNHEQPVGKQWKWYTTTSGIWQTVFIEPRGAIHIDQFRIYPDIDKSSAHFEVSCPSAPADCELSIEISPPDNDGADVQIKVPVRNGHVEASIKIDPLLLWDPNRPHLYGLKLTLYRGAEIQDKVYSYFGMRKIDFEQSDGSDRPAFLRLNGVARYLRGALYQSYHPDGVYTASDVEVLKGDIEAAKKFGFNFLRVHIKVDDPLLYYWADKLGMLLMADMPNFGEGGDTPLGRKRWEQMMRQAVKRDFNHPSIFAWCIFNETWGFGGQVEFVKNFDQSLLCPPKPENEGVPGAVSAESHPSAKEVARAQYSENNRLDNAASHKWVHGMWQLTKQLDPTRLVEDMSVCHWEHLDYFQHTETDINSWHFYLNDYAKAKEHIQRVVQNVYRGSTFNYVEGFEHQGTPLINSEYGGIGALDGDRDMSWSFKFLTNELRRHEHISAYIYTELHDVEWEYNGFLNYDRTMKDIGYDPRIVNESDALPIDAPPISKLAPGQTLDVLVASSHYSTRQKQNVTLHWRLGGMDTRGRLHQDLARGKTRIPFPHRRVAHAHTIFLTMPEETMLCCLTVEALAESGLVVAQNHVEFFVSNAYPPQAEHPDPDTWVLRPSLCDWDDAWWSEGQEERDGARREDRVWGKGHGFFDWSVPLNGRDISRARRIRVLCEAASHRTDTPQTDQDIYPTTMQILLNGVRVFEGVLRNHPHDSRGVLSYLRGAKGAYGYLTHAYADRDSLQEVVRNMRDDRVQLRFAVPQQAMACGGLTIYGAECGHYPVSPTMIIEW